MIVSGSGVTCYLLRCSFSRDENQAKVGARCQVETVEIQIAKLARAHNAER